MTQEQQNAEDTNIIKLAAAERYKERNVRPTTAAYLFDRAMGKAAAEEEAAQPKGLPVKPALKKVAAPVKPVAKPALKKVAAPVKPALKKTAAPAKPSPATKLKKEAAKPDMTKITKLASNLKKVLPAKA